MKKVIVLLAVTALVALACWYAARNLPREAPPGGHGPATPAMPALGPECGDRCGAERWAVKTLSDPDRACVNLAPVDATVEQLALLEAPAWHRNMRRVAPVECTVYRVAAHLAGWDSLMKGERDRDLHVVLFGQTDQRAHLIAEIPDPICPGACRSGFGGRFAQVRSALLAELRDPQSPLGRDPDHALVVVTGVGFFDKIHHQTGVAPNGFELHPVLSIEFPPLDSTAARKSS